MTKKRTLAGFADVANNNANVNVNINNNKGLEEILGDAPAKQLVGIYFEPDLAAALDRLAAGKKGAKSALVNKAVREFLQSHLSGRV